jgi:uncharacterized protein YggE
MSSPIRLALVAAALPAAALAQVPSAPLQLPAGTRLDVVATGEVARTPDIATISAGVVTQSATPSAALSDNAARMAASIAALRRAGVADRDIQTSALSLSPQYRYQENSPPVITGYQASNQVTVRFRDVKRAGPILDTLVAQGANQINGPTFSVDKPEPALDEARTRAVRHCPGAGRTLCPRCRHVGPPDRRHQRGWGPGHAPAPAHHGDCDAQGRVGRHLGPGRRADAVGDRAGDVRAAVALKRKAAPVARRGLPLWFEGRGLPNLAAANQVHDREQDHRAKQRG